MENAVIDLDPRCSQRQQIDTRDNDIATQLAGVYFLVCKQCRYDRQMFGLDKGNRAFSRPSVVAVQAIRSNTH